MRRKEVVFVGAQENGRIVLQCLLDCNLVDVVAAYTYDDEIQVRKPMAASFDDIYPSIVKITNIEDYARNIMELAPDFIFVAGWSHVLSESILSAAKMGCIGFHPSMLPRDRGRSTLAWQIAEGYTETALTMFYLCKEVDAGDIIAQERIPIDPLDEISDILKKVNKATYNLMTTYLPLIVYGRAPRIPQDHRKATYRRLRTEVDSHIDWTRPVVEIHNLVRALAPPYPCAHTYLGDKKLRVVKGCIISGVPEKYWYSKQPGTILSFWHTGELWVKARDGIYSCILDESPLLALSNEGSWVLK